MDIMSMSIMTSTFSDPNGTPILHSKLYAKMSKKPTLTDLTKVPTKKTIN